VSLRRPVVLDPLLDPVLEHLRAACLVQAEVGERMLRSCVKKVVVDVDPVWRAKCRLEAICVITHEFEVVHSARLNSNEPDFRDVVPGAGVGLCGHATDHCNLSDFDLEEVGSGDALALPYEIEVYVVSPLFPRFFVVESKLSIFKLLCPRGVRAAEDVRPHAPVEVEPGGLDDIYILALIRARIRARICIRHIQHDMRLLYTVEKCIHIAPYTSHDLLI